ncbi:MAG TPA: threonine synthase, partial [Stenotrophomonas sp.]|nr:threonine synthase [Stenotrophomonas sp.]
LAAGLAPDGGLYVPEHRPRLQHWSAHDSFAQTAAAVLAPYFHDDALVQVLPELCAQAFNFDAPLRPLATADDHVLELFHGPTAAFKDFGARFLAACLARLQQGRERRLTIVVATSGDTGAAGA